MADPTLTNIQILRSPVPHKRPDPTLMLDGQLAVNYKAVDPGLFTKTVEGTLVKFGPISITNDGLSPNHTSLADGFAGNSHGESWLDGRAAFYSPIQKVYDADKDEWVTSSGFVVDDSTGNLTLMKWLTVDRLYAEYVSINGQLDVDGNFLPSGTNCVHDLGSASNRWKGLYSCLIDTTGNLTVGGDADISGFVQVGNYLTVNSDADLLGTVTIGTTPTSGDTLKVNSPTNFDSSVDIVGDVTANSQQLAGDLTVKGNVALGDGCGVTTLEVHSPTTFHCQVNFNTNPVFYEYLTVEKELISQGNTILGTDCATDTLTVTAASTFNCTTEHEGELRVGRVSGAEFRAFGDATVAGLTRAQSSLEVTGTVTISQKGYSEVTVDTDPINTLTTKGWVVDWLTKGQFWVESGVTLRTTSPNRSIVPNSGTGTIGLAADRWDYVYAESLSLSQKGYSAQTVASDPDNTLITKKYFESNAVTNSGNITLGDGCLTSTVNLNGRVMLYCDMLPAVTRAKNIGSINNELDNIYSRTLILSGKGYSEPTAASDPDNTLITKKYFEDNILPSVGNITIGNGCATSSINLNGAVTLSCDMVPNVPNTRDIGTNTNRMKAIYAQDVYTGDLHLKNDRGSWTMIEEEDVLTIRNNKTGKRFAITMTPYEG